MLEKWCHDQSDCPAIELVGSLRRESVPEELYGMLSALLFRSSEMGEDIEDALNAMGVHLPKTEYRLVMFSLDDPQFQELSGRMRHYCRINLYHEIRKYMLDMISQDTDGFLFYNPAICLDCYIPRQGITRSWKHVGRQWNTSIRQSA